MVNSWHRRKQSGLVVLQKKTAALAMQMTVMSHLLRAIQPAKTYLTEFWYVSFLEANSVRKETECWCTAWGTVFFQLNNFVFTKKNKSPCPPAPEYSNKTWRLLKNVKVSLSCFIPHRGCYQTHSLNSKWWKGSCDENGLLKQLRHTDNKTIVFQLSLKNYFF